MRFLEQDSRPTTDGGIFLVDDFFGSLDPDIGVGASYEVSRSMAIRLRLAYLYLSLGLEFII